MSVWFEGSNEIDCTIHEVKKSLENLGQHYVGVVSLMPGLTSVELVEQGNDFVTIRTNEGLMTRTKIAKSIESARVVVELDEEYQAGSKVTVKSHFLHEFTPSDAGVTHRTVVSNVEAPGLLGFLYRKSGRGKMGKAFLDSYKTYLETREG